MIKTKYIGPTDTRGSRIKASYGGKQVSIAYDYALNFEQRHLKAAQAFANKHNLTINPEAVEDSAGGLVFEILKN